MGILLTMDADQGVEAMQLINPREVVPIHYNDYEVFKSTLEEIRIAVNAAGLGGRVRYLSHGETYEFQIPAERLWSSSPNAMSVSRRAPPPESVVFADFLHKD